MLTVWFPLMDVDVKDGCLCVWPGSHHRGLLDHCPSKAGLAVPGKLLEGKAVPMIMEKGDALLMHKQTLHASYSNTSNRVRFSLDLRYNPIGQPTGRPAFPALWPAAASIPRPTCASRQRGRSFGGTPAITWRRWKMLAN